jgi:hypothetical protein
MTIKMLKEVLLKVYDKSTAHYKWKSKWKKTNPTIGQCVPTALLVQYYFGGDIYKHNVESHYYNVINGEVIDLTKEQFNYELDYTNDKKQQPILSQSKTKERFELLKEKVENYIKQMG